MPKIKKFRENESDNLHCLQACYIMAVHTLTDQWLPIEQAEIETGFVKGAPTWEFEAMLNLAKKGLSVISIDDSDFSLFKQGTRSYLESFIDDEKEIKAMLDITNDKLEQSRVLKVLAEDKIKMIKKAPSLQDLSELLKDDYIIIANVNSKTLAGKDGYMGHSVIVDEIKDDFVILQDPGYPGKPNRKVDKATFIKAWAYFGEDTTAMFAVGKGK